MKPLSILLLEDSYLDAELVTNALRSLPIAHTIKHADSKKSFLEALVVSPPDIVLADYNLPDYGATHALEVVNKCSPKIPLVVVSGSVGDEAAVEVVTKGGAVDYVLKDNLVRLVPTVMRTMDRVYSQIQLDIFREQLVQASKSEALGLMAAGIAHDFNNVLAAISGNAELMMMDKSSSPFLDKIKLATKRGSGLTQQLLDFTRNEPHKLRIIDSNKVVSETYSLLSSILKGHVDFQIATRAAPSLVYADKTQLEQIVTNFAINARDAISDSGTVDISTSTLKLSQYYDVLNGRMEPGEYVCIKVKDDGCGMSEETRQKIFQPFYTTKGKKGTGLGLSVVYGIVAQNNWFLQVESGIGKGTSMQVYIPAANDRRDSKYFADCDNGFSKILFVDDETTLSTLVQAYLEDQGYSVMTADSLQSATERYKIQRPDLILCDISLPDGLGPDFVKSMRFSNPNLKAIYHSGYPGTDILKNAGEESVPFLKKPWNIHDLTALINQELKK